MITIAHAAVINLPAIHNNSVRGGVPSGEAPLGEEGEEGLAGDGGDEVAASAEEVAIEAEGGGADGEGAGDGAEVEATVDERDEGDELGEGRAEEMDGPGSGGLERSGHGWHG